jgi:cysteinyl-tRNA synthetase
LRDFTGKHEAAFLEDLRNLNCASPHELPHATDHIPEIIGLIQQLIDRGLAYRTSDGSVYFSIEKYRSAGGRYGQLVKLNFDQMRPGERVASDEYDKQALADFALWKARVPEDGDVFWPSPWGPGRPGWHIECSAMSMKLLGPSFDLHIGGEDLMFPHHEDEIAQSEGAGLQPPGQRFVKYWMHAAHLLVEGRKMSKSLGNFFTLRDLLAQGFTGREVRYLLLTAHYRETFNFTLEGLEGARHALGRIDECLAKLRELSDRGQSEADATVLGAFTRSLDDDLNVSGAWGVIFEWIRELNRRLAASQMSPPEAASALATWDRMNAVLALGSAEVSAAPPDGILLLLEQRQAARQSKDFSRADVIRDELKAKGWIIEDTPKGPRLKRA